MRDPSLIVALATLSAGFLAAAAAFLATILLKENKVSDLRQAWIDALREDLAEYLALSRIVPIHRDLADGARYLIEGPARDNAAGQKFDILERQERMRVCALRLILRLEPKKHSALVEAIREVERATLTATPTSSENLELAAEKVQLEGVRVINEVWRRVRRGEPWFLFAKYGGLLIAVVIFVVIVYAWIVRIGGAGQ
jgi:hypothetical protein